MDIYEEIVSALTAEDRVMLATIVSSSGSTPVPAGAKMLMTRGARIPCGTVGGGCLEADIQEVARRLYETGGAAGIRTFILTEDNIESGMACGGRVDILVEPITKNQSPMYAEILKRRACGEDSMVLTAMNGGGLTAKELLSLKPGEGDSPAKLDTLRHAFGDLPASLHEEITGAHRRGEVARVSAAGGEIILEPVIGLQDLIVFGGGHISKSVCRSAALAGFRVTVVDDRPDYANPERFPEAARTLACRFEDAWDLLGIRSSSSIVIVTRGHKFDEMILERAVRTPARYVGMIGSRRKVLLTYRHLREQGIPDALLRTVRAPIGLRIGAVTAEEIAISITAELIAVRRGVHGPAAPMSHDGGGESPEEAG